MILLRTLGSIDLRGADGKELRSIVVQPKRLALLVYLALVSSRGFQRREQLMALFWPELDSARARNALSQALHVLRRGLGEDALVNRGNEEVGLADGKLRCDAVEFAVAVGSGRWADALPLYRGDLLEGFFVPDASAELEEWLDRERGRLRRMAVEAALALAAEAEQQGELSLAMHWASWAAEREPYDDAPLRRKLAILERQGDHAAAARAYDDFTRRLRTDLAAEPAASLQALLAWTRVPEPTLADLPNSPGEATAPGPTSLPEIERPGVVRRAPRRLAAKWAAAGGIATLLAIGMLATALSFERGAPPAAAERTVAVLPFVDLTPARDQEVFSDGITEELLDALSRIEGLRVAGRTSSFSFKGKNVPADSIARALGVSYLVVGGVRMSGGRLRISAQLIDARNGYQLWSDSYDRELKDPLAIQDEIARAVAQVLRVRLADNTGRPLLTGTTPDPIAYDHYLNGLYHYNRRSNEAAVVRLEQAVERDPEFARAYAILARVYLGLPVNNAAFDVATYMRKSREAVDRALALDPWLPEAHTALGILLYRHEWDYAGGEREVRHAIALNPSNGVAYETLAQIEERKGRTEHALRSIERAEALDPARPQAACLHAYLLVHARRYAEALRQYERALQKHDFSCGEAAIEAYYSLGRFREAAGAARMHYRRVRSPVDAALLTRMSDDVLDAKARGRAPRSDLVRAVEESGIPFEPFVLAKWYAWAGDHDAALRVFERMVAERHPAAIWLTFPFFDPLHSDPRYRALEARMGFSSARGG